MYINFKKKILNIHKNILQFNGFFFINLKYKIKNMFLNTVKMRNARCVSKQYGLLKAYELGYDLFMK